MGKVTLLVLVAIALSAVFIALKLRATNSLSDDIARAYEEPAAPNAGPLNVFHLGHSLVGRDMPAMLAQLAGAGHGYASQLGWGTSLKEHWEPALEINGFAVENDHPRFRDARDALGSGEFDTFVLTEMVEIRDAIRYHQSARYMEKWVKLSREHNPEIRVFLYESWHRLDDPEGWLTRLDKDLARYWEDKLLIPAMAVGSSPPIYVIPAGQVMAHFVRAVETAGGIGEVSSHEDLFARDDDGTLDMIHFNDLGAYLVALTHYAVLYQSSPLGLPTELVRADGSPAVAPSGPVARAMQESVWEVVTSYAKTGVRP